VTDYCAFSLANGARGRYKTSHWEQQLIGFHPSSLTDRILASRTCRFSNQNGPTPRCHAMPGLPTNANGARYG